MVANSMRIKESTLDWSIVGLQSTQNAALGKSIWHERQEITQVAICKCSQKMSHQRQKGRGGAKALEVTGAQALGAKNSHEGAGQQPRCEGNPTRTEQETKRKAYQARRGSPEELKNKGHTQGITMERLRISGESFFSGSGGSGSHLLLSEQMRRQAGGVRGRR
jgi:hypothetical protein